MHGSMLFGFLVGVVLFKAIRRFFWWRHGYGGHGCGGGGCGGGHRHGWRGHSWRGWHGYGQWDGPQSWQSDSQTDYSRWSGAMQGGGAAARTTGKPIEELVRGLELNDRQRDEAIPVLTLLRDRLGARGLRVETALKIVAADRFDPSPLVSQLGDLPPPAQHELVDGLEHLHTILISEQREVLRKSLGLPDDPSAPTTPTTPSASN